MERNGMMEIQNPSPLARIFIILQMNVSAMLGYTGAIFKEFFGSGMGTIIGFAILCFWVIVPYWISLSRFVRKDL